jgi:hypothetical protein
MAGTKTTFFGSLYAFERNGVDEFISAFRKSYEEGSDAAPFVSYLPKENVSQV